MRSGESISQGILLLLFFFYFPIEVVVVDHVHSSQGKSCLNICMVTCTVAIYFKTKFCVIMSLVKAIGFSHRKCPCIV